MTNLNTDMSLSDTRGPHATLVSLAFQHRGMNKTLIQTATEPSSGSYESHNYTFAQGIMKKALTKHENRSTHHICGVVQITGTGERAQRKEERMHEAWLGIQPHSGPISKRDAFDIHLSPPIKESSAKLVGGTRLEQN